METQVCHRPSAGISNGFFSKEMSVCVCLQAGCTSLGLLGVWTLLSAHVLSAGLALPLRAHLPKCASRLPASLALLLQFPLSTQGPADRTLSPQGLRVGPARGTLSSSRIFLSDRFLHQTLFHIEKYIKQRK